MITGGTSGIGECLMQLIAEQGINIVLVARQAGKLEKVASAIKNKYGVDVKTVQADLSKPEAISSVVAQTNDLDVGLFVPCAGIENHGRMSGYTC